MILHGIDLAGMNRHAADVTAVRVEDIDRQTVTAVELLRRLGRRPVQLLADEVGMGKTYVALAVAAALKPVGRPARVAVLVPNEELRRKWQREVRDFMAACVTNEALSLRPPTGPDRFDVEDLADLSRGSPRRQLAIIRYGAFGLASKKFKDAEKRYHCAAVALSRDPSLAGWRQRLSRVFDQAGGESGDLDQSLVQAVRRLRTGQRPLLATKMPSGKNRWSATHIEGRCGRDVWAAAVEAVQTVPKNCSYSTLQAALRVTLRDLVSAALIAQLPVFDLVIVDEAHNWVNRAKGANEARLAYLHRARSALLLTATPLQLEADDLPNLLGQFSDLGAHVKIKPPQILKEELDKVTGRLRRAAGAAEQFRLAWAVAPPGVEVNIAGSSVDVRHERLDAAVEELDRANRQLEGALQPWLVRHRRNRGHRRVLVGEELVPANLREPRPAIAENTVLHDAVGTVDDGAQLAQLALMRLVALAAESPGRTTLGASMTGCYSTIIVSKEGKHLFTRQPEVKPYRALLQPHIDTEGRLLDGRRVRVSNLHPKLQGTLQTVEESWAQGDKVLVYCWRVNTARVVAAAIRQQLGTRTADPAWRRLQRRVSGGPGTLDRLVHSLCLAGRLEVPYDELANGARDDFEANASKLRLPERLRPEDVRRVHRLYQSILAEAALSSADDRSAALLRAYLDTAPSSSSGSSRATSGHSRFLVAITDDASLLTGATTLGDHTHPAAKLAKSLARYTDRWEHPGDALIQRSKLLQLLRSIIQSQETLARLPGLDPSSEMTTEDLAAAMARPMRRGGRGRQAESLLERLADLVDSLTAIKDERNLDDALNDLEGTRPPVAELSGRNTGVERSRTFDRFNSPLFPDVLVCTQIGGEGIDLQRYCRVVIHYDLSFNPAKFEQRTGRCDRIGSKSEREGADLIVGVPLLAGSYDERIYATLLQRDREQEALIGSGVGGEQGIEAIEADLEDSSEESVERPARPIPQDLVEALRCNYHVWSPSATASG